MSTSAHRINVEVTPKTFERAAKLIPAGKKRKLVSALLEQMLDLIEEHGYVAVTAIEMGFFKIECNWDDILRSVAKVKGENLNDT